MNVSLTPELERLIRDKVASGEYVSESEVVSEALRLLVLQDQRYQRKVEALQAKIQQGIDDLDAGRASPIDEAFTRLRARRERLE